VVSIESQSCKFNFGHYHKGIMVLTGQPIEILQGPKAK
jgi:hypothetical protein